MITSTQPTGKCIIFFICYVLNTPFLFICCVLNTPFCTEYPFFGNIRILLNEDALYKIPDTDEVVPTITNIVIKQVLLPIPTL